MRDLNLMCAITVIFMDKNQARKMAYSHYKEMDELTYLERMKEILESITSFEPFIQAKKVGIYYPIKKEINLLSLMHLYPKKIFYFPRLEGKTLSFRQISDIENLEGSKFGTRQPKKDAVIEKEIDVYFVPCVLTSGLYRIGHGKGYYDYYFKEHQGLKVGIVHKALKNKDVKVNEFDIPMDIIL